MTLWRNGQHVWLRIRRFQVRPLARSHDLFLYTSSSLRWGCNLGNCLKYTLKNIYTKPLVACPSNCIVHILFELFILWFSSNSSKRTKRILIEKRFECLVCLPNAVFTNQKFFRPLEITAYFGFDQGSSLAVPWFYTFCDILIMRTHRACYFNQVTSYEVCAMYFSVKL